MLEIIYRCLLFFIKLKSFIIAHIVLLFPKTIFKLLLPHFIPIILWSLGYNKPTITDKRKHKNDKDIPIIVYQHSTFADHYILLYIFNSVKYVVFDKHRQSNIVVKRFTDLFGCIPVFENTKTGAAKKIQEYINDGDYSVKLAIAPEGGRRIDDDGNQVLVHFSTGAFVPLAPIQPVTIQFKFNDIFDNPTWNYDYAETNIAKWYFWRFFAIPVDINVTLMEEAYPTENMTPKEYCQDVRNKMTYEITGNPLIFKNLDNKINLEKQENNKAKEEIIKNEDDLKDTKESTIDLESGKIEEKLDNKHHIEQEE